MKKFVVRPYATMKVRDVLSYLDTSERGLSYDVAQERLRVFGSNVLPSDKKRSRIMLFLRQFHSPLVYIIMVTAGTSVVIGHASDAFFMVIVVLINTLVGFIQEDKAEKALASLKKTMERQAVAVRGGRPQEINVTEIVVGDIIQVTAGDYIAADGRLLYADRMTTNEAVLTGESESVVKKSAPLEDVRGIGDQNNMLFTGSYVAQGDGKYIATQTGSDTELGRIASLVRNQETVKEPLTQEFEHLSRVIGVSVLIGIVFFAIIGIMRGQTIDEVFVTATALVVSAIPEGLLPAVTMVMVFGVRRLAKKRALVRRLNATETIGAITAICTDKTGTITEGEMQASIVAVSGDAIKRSQWQQEERRKIDHFTELNDWEKVLCVGAIVNDAFIEKKTKSETLGESQSEIILRGRSTDKALLNAGLEAGFIREQFFAQYELLDKIPFSSERKFAARIYKSMNTDEIVVCAIGAPERIMERANLSSVGKDMHDQYEKLAGDGLRVLACGWQTVQEKDLEKVFDAIHMDVKELIYGGLIGIEDPVRESAREALATAKKAGIRSLIVTGDHASTVQAIVGKLGWNVSDDEIYTGAQVDVMGENQLRDVVMKASIFARVEPVHKIRIVKALQEQGEIVAMVGDGINDAPALKAAHVGISMGNGTDMTKNVADIVLLDSSFATVIGAIEQGRAIFDNIRRIIIYLVADNFSALFVFFVAMLLGYPLPLLAAQILWINLVEDSLPNIALTTERDTEGIMSMPPRKPGEPILSTLHKKFISWIFAISALAAVGIFFVTMQMTGDIDLARTMTFVMIAFDSLALTYILRSFHKSVFRTTIFENRWINIATAVALGLLVLGVTWKPLMNMLGTVYLSVGQWCIIIVITFIEVVILEYAKKKIFGSNKNAK